MRNCGVFRRKGATDGGEDHRSRQQPQTRLLWPDFEHPESNRYALDVLSAASDGAVFHAPTIWHYEAAHVAASLARTERVSQASAVSYFEQLALLPVVTDVAGHANAAKATFGLSIRFALSAYDAAYLELVLRVGGSLAANDKRLRAAARRAGASLFP